MSRRNSIWCLVVFLLAVGWLCLLPYLRDPAVQVIPAKLDKPINLESRINVGTSLRDALNLLEEKAEVTILIDDQAFRRIQVENVQDSGVKFPKAIGIRPATVLRLLLSQVNAS